jgi:hypothetical protein
VGEHTPGVGFGRTLVSLSPLFPGQRTAASGAAGGATVLSLGATRVDRSMLGRARSACDEWWPKMGGKAKVAKSKFRLKPRASLGGGGA